MYCPMYYFELRQLRTARRSLSPDILKTRSSRVYWITVTPCLLNYRHVTARLQSVQNAVTRLFGGISKLKSVQPVLRDVLHWLPIGDRITCKVTLLTYKALHGLTPSYLTDVPVSVARNPALHRNRSADRGDLLVLRVKNTSYVDSCTKAVEHSTV